MFVADSIYSPLASIAKFFNRMISDNMQLSYPLTLLTTASTYETKGAEESKKYGIYKKY
jgi:hypothetical protein